MDNIETDLDITNGAQGEIVNIIWWTTHQWQQACCSFVVPSCICTHQTQPHLCVLTSRSQIPVKVAMTSMKISIWVMEVKWWNALFSEDNILSLQHIYGVLSQSSGRNTIRLLRDFDEQYFRQSHESSPHLKRDLRTLDLAVAASPMAKNIKCSGNKTMLLAGFLILRLQLWPSKKPWQAISCQCQS